MMIPTLGRTSGDMGLRNCSSIIAFDCVAFAAVPLLPILGCALSVHFHCITVHWNSGGFATLQNTSLFKFYSHSKLLSSRDIHKRIDEEYLGHVLCYITISSFDNEIGKLNLFSQPFHIHYYQARPASGSLPHYLVVGLQRCPSSPSSQLQPGSLLRVSRPLQLRR